MNTPYLLDSHALIWFLSGSKEMPKKIQKIITDTENECYVSIASIWEIGLKINLGKLQLGISFEELAEVLNLNQIKTLPITFKHILALNKLENIHKDPFDRIILCQSKIEKIKLISRDSVFKRYKDVEIIW
ncbi:type II toxin-antitoxin system VapC family toxin [uncultured Arcticibacterium sp.]|uniref:type II toxin-antitoxin system VapC family toxin n=1 Tax=uncultured Arcticibacterium sp. TaxID=2173042 RepID=UPI0030FC3B76